MIFSKPLDKCPLRLQRLRLTLQSYDFEVKYKRGSQLYIADALSRASHKEDNFKILESEVEAHVHLIEFAGMSPEKFNQLVNETMKDPELITLKTVINEGWPKSKDEVKDLIKPYWDVRESLVVINNAVFKGNQYVVPKSMRAEIIAKLHYSHLGIEKTRLRARELVYWPNVNKEIKDVIQNCHACLAYGRSNPQEEMITKEMAVRPWQIVAADFFYLNDNQYLLLVDEYSKYPEVVHMRNDTSSVKVVKEFKAIFSRHGIPNLLYTDGGPQFVSNNFQQFVREWGIIHKTSSPRYPKSNGFIERHVQTIKQILKKCYLDKKDAYLALLEYRNTPISNEIPSPAELLLGRKIKGCLPVPDFQLHPQFQPNQILQTKTLNKQNYKYYYDRKSHQLPNLKIGQTVMVQNFLKKKWEPGIIKNFDKRPRSYVVEMFKQGNQLIRNRKFLKPITNENLFNNDYKFQNLFEKNIQEQLPKEKVNENVRTFSNRNLQHTDPSREAVRYDGNNTYVTKYGRSVKKPNYYKP
ncbi:hypothetical protein PPYR_08399 [Photinus pyralis]|nr:hypothetical protein PPYR_08399 [Photinus pyralis]